MSIKPHFIVKNKFQKRQETYSQILTNDILLDICKKTTGKSEFTIEFDQTGYNKGRLVKIKYKDKEILLFRVFLQH